jgi:mannosyltransferase OCH1-like enzyme
MKSINPEYTHMIYDDYEIDEFVNDVYPGEISKAYNKLNIVVAKVDFWRYLILYKFGGIYLDMDSTITESLDKLISLDSDAIISPEGNPNKYCQWCLIFNKNHPILEKTIQYVVENIEKNLYPNDIINMTGPGVYSRAINDVHEEFFNQKLNWKIDHSMDMLFKNDKISYRIYGCDYNGIVQFKYPESIILYQEKKSWRDEMRCGNSLLK